ncbi:MAG: hypothetical protein ALECFALPRED_007598 [Alectoria fallacina]|uniref:Uncharacterized protein n=1 Tax=Alectoria fallacina TaxID=1903189 RepID=A0A8H3G8W6_9LECA|nr:MAG: hypothetical protein ALECFALPRED_007598 [Alectoria fallacina]
MASCMAIRHDAVQKFHDIFPRSIETVKLTDPRQRHRYGVECTYGRGNAEEFFADLHQLKNHGSLYRFATFFYYYYCRRPDAYVWDKTLPSLVSNGVRYREGCTLHNMISCRRDKRLELA